MYQLIFKRYAPFATFGGGFHGDNRQGPKLDGTARTSAIVEFDLGKPILNHFGYSGESYHVKLPSIRKTGKTGTKIWSQHYGPDMIRFEVQSWGKLPFLPSVIPGDIDTFVNVSILRQRDGTLSVAGRVTGDDFPNAEVFLVNPDAGKHACIVDFRTNAGQTTGPITRLMGPHRQQLVANVHAVVRL